MKFTVDGVSRLAVSDSCPTVACMATTTAAPEAPTSMTAAEVARLLHASKSSVNDWRAQGRLEAFQTPGGGWRYPVAQPALAEPLAALQRAQGAR